MMRSLLVRGMLVGPAAAAVALAIAWIYGEPQVGHAIAFEESRAAGHAHHGAAAEPAEEAPVSRTAQQTIGLITAMGFYGVAVGGLFAIAFAFAYGRLGALGARATSALVALAGFVAVVLVPFLKYPATPPAVGDPDTIGGRTALYFSMVALGVLATTAAVIAGRRLAPRLGAWNASVVSAVGFAVVLAVVFRLTPRPDAVADGFPATVLWDFRVASLGVQIALWATLGLLFGHLTERSLARRPSPEAVAA
ncbi:CbtA family protein [Actinomadura kijaniata]|uniref:Putative cobalt transporter CbtA n=1 Tax=Actinomadura namibiensis TaxID=182080 RepID=A0A7W3LJJ1_ACTNM|nr:CbtA family protein [Actinomadura namibiensis]MBA8949245.1 putative cobalt transporter CbtA [Actinomadura namibiensis]